MAFISTKIIYGKKQYYLEESIRLPDGKTRKFSLYLKGYTPPKPYPQLPHYQKELAAMVKQGYIATCRSFYKKNAVFTEETLTKLEERKLDYKEIIKKVSEKQFEDILDRFTINFTYESNAIEGNSLTLKDVAFIIQEDHLPKGKNLREVYETINTRKAFDWIKKNNPKITEETIITLHRILVKDTGVALGYKQLPNFLLGRMVKTALPEEVPTEMKKLIAWYYQNNHLHPLQRAAWFHGAFEKIHPFEDGNGRVGRILLNVMLWQNDYPLLIIRKTQRVAYLHALDAFDQGYADKLYYFLLNKHGDTYEKFFRIYIKYLK